MKKKRQQRKIIKQQQRNFIQNWSPYDEKKQYTALQDPHANYYFYNKSVNKHLKQLKKVINQQKNVKQKQALKSQIKTKLSAIKLPNIKISPKTAIYANQINKSMSELPTHYRKKSEAVILSMSRKQEKQKQQKQTKNQHAFSVIETDRYRKFDNNSKSNKQSLESSSNNTDMLKSKIKSTQQYITRVVDSQKSKRITHSQFLNFLVQKKKQLGHLQTQQHKPQNQRNQKQQIKGNVTQLKQNK